MRKTIKQLQGESDYWRVKFINEQKRAEAAAAKLAELEQEQAEHDGQIANLQGKFDLALAGLRSKAARCEKAEAKLSEIKARLSCDEIKAIINDDWILMDECEGFKNCNEVKWLAILALSALSDCPTELNERGKDEKPSFHLLHGESEYDRLERMYRWMKSNRKADPELPSLLPVNNCLTFFASTIKSGESWSSTCEREYNAALSILRNIEEAR